MEIRLDGKLAVVTGGGSGLGLAMARAIADSGARVVIVGRREKVLRDACERIGPSASWTAADISDAGQVKSFVDKVNDEIGPPDIVINNAGIHLKSPVADTSLEEFERVLKTHVYGAYAVTQGFIPGMIKRKSGSIIFIASMASFIGMPNIIAYTAAKSAYTGMVRELTAELSPFGIRVNGIAPGWIDTDMLHQALDDDPERKAKILSRTPMERFGRPDDIGNAALFLCSEAASFITGVVLPVDGGALIGF